MREFFRTVRILVAGDVMLDEYWFGEVRRISPEAPVPIVHVSRSDVRPGGAANVARNIVSLGGQVDLLAPVGPDSTAARLREVLEEAGVNHCLCVDHDIRTTLKLRVIGQQQQMLRVDFEEEPSDGTLLTKREEFERLAAFADLIILSDYGKGALRYVQDLISRAREMGKMVLVDPKGRDYARYAGATALTPNRSELADAVGGWSSEAEMDYKAEQLRSSLGLAALVLTLSEQGMKVYLPGRHFHQAAKAREVFDVSGAGDTVIAALAVMLGASQSWDDAAAFANTAAGVAVGKLGTSTVDFEEVWSLLNAETADAGGVS